MQYVSKRAQHTQLVLKMADRQDIDLAELVMRGEFSNEDMSDAVDRCTSCLHPDECSHLVDTASGDVSLPDYCRNGAMFERLNSE